jgi:hypothetical protein
LVTGSSPVAAMKDTDCDSILISLPYPLWV